ncbi:SIR2 family protein [Leptospira sp. GIMC2001]|uniref:SIR2 family protein n=1 Tax=Leptospira sp. GIMC2001 TaxID=1513297 RepID=UPI00234B366D|nr:SIR2 family protein [Leptospira sp. GIMC2001]WCL51030.1 SIR2 family protein [Leptospira sp. GIMC2001]
MNKHQNIVFFIGAGFSAPSGIPIMGNFINKAKDLYFSDPDSYLIILETLQLIERYSLVKNYMNVNLFNIEDLLSIAYMDSLIQKDTKSLDNITHFIKTVITSYTDPNSNHLNSFTKLVTNIKISNTQTKAIIGSKSYTQFNPDGIKFADTKFAIISLNYDMLIENALSNNLLEISNYYSVSQRINPFENLIRPVKSPKNEGVPFAKLHGSLDTRIIPPTWNKNIEKDIHEDWELASEVISNATHIIFLGYSLPVTDNYIKFLFSSSLSRNNKLKYISAITIDNDNNTKNRFNAMFEQNFTFHNTNLENFFLFTKEMDRSIYFDFDNFDVNFAKFVSML